MKILVFAVASANMISLDWEKLTRGQKLRWCKAEYWTFQREDTVGNIIKEIQRPKECYDFARGPSIKGPLTLFSNARSYGCWCDFDNAFRFNSTSQPVNALDRACMELYQNYNLIQSELPDCNPRVLNAAEDYILPLSSVSPVIDHMNECQIYNNDDTCGFRICLVEAHFLRLTYQPVVLSYQDWLEIWNDIDRIHRPHGGNFDYEGQCILSDDKLHRDESSDDRLEGINLDSLTENQRSGYGFAQDFLLNFKKYIEKMSVAERSDFKPWFA